MSSKRVEQGRAAVKACVAMGEPDRSKPRRLQIVGLVRCAFEVVHERHDTRMSRRDNAALERAVVSAASGHVARRVKR